MSAYAVARLYDVAMGPEIVAYLQKIDETLAPFGGQITPKARLFWPRVCCLTIGQPILADFTQD